MEPAGTGRDAAYRSESGVAREASPDGRLIVEYVVHGQLMSHETIVPRLIEAATGRTLLAMPDSLHDGTISWAEDGIVRLDIRHYQGGEADAIIDLSAGTVRAAGETVPLADAMRLIAQQIRRTRAGAAPR